MSASITIEDLQLCFGDHTVLDGVSLTVGAGSWVTVIGPNGAGKTSLLRALVGAVPFDGRIDVDGVAGNSSVARARMISLVPQTPVIPPGIRVLDYVLLGRTPHRGVFSRESRHDLEVVAEVLERLDLLALADRDVRSLSGGERQRVVLGRAIAQQARLLLLDEPTTALDLGHQQDVLDLVEELRSETGLTVLATLHDLTLAGRYGDRIALLAEGRIVAEGQASEVLTETNIAAYFDARVRVLDHEGRPVVVPVV